MANCLLQHRAKVQDIGMLPDGDIQYDASNGLMQGDVLYFRKIIRLLETRRTSGITYLLTWGLTPVAQLPPNCWVFLVGDECQQPSLFYQQASMVLKTGGLYPNSLSYYQGMPLGLACRIGLRELRNFFSRLQRRARGERLGQNSVEIPIGPYCPEPSVTVPMSKRLVDVFYAARAADVSNATLIPKKYARTELMHALQSVDASAEVLVTGLSADTELSIGAYAEQLSQSKIILCPRGNFEETYRVFEAARAGCVIICDKLPDRWYYQDHPAIELHDWRQLPSLLAELLADEQRLEALHNAGLEWWQTKASEQAVADYIIENSHVSNEHGKKR